MTDPDPDPVRDPRRLDALRDLRALDTPADEGLDALADLARNLLGAPVALVTLVDEDRQFFKSCLGVDEPWSERRQTPLSHSFCRHAIASDEPLAIEDAREHPLVSDNPAIRELGVVAYLGIPLFTHGGQAVGTLCAIDHEPREWTEEDVLLLQSLSEAVLRRLELLARTRELEEARKEMAEKETYFRALIERGMDAVTLLDEEGRIRYTSPNSAEILGETPEERDGRSGFEKVHPDDQGDLREQFLRALSEPGRATRVEFRYRHGDGRWLHLEGVGRNLLHVPAVEGIVFNFRDVTARKEMEGELRQKQKLETIGELTAGIAHDFNNLLAVVSANAALLRDGLRPDAGEAVQDLEDLQAAARAGADLVRSLTTFSRRDELALRPTDLGELVKQIGRMLRRILPSSIDVEWEIAPDLPPARVEARAVEQILLNLATNARDAMPRGGSLTIRLGMEEDRAGTSSGGSDEEEGPFLVLEVADTGRGMDEETLEKAFRPFFTTKEVGAGTGLGLAMVSRLVEQNRGRIEVESEVGKGTRMTIRFPRASGAVAVEPTREGTAHAARGDELVLVVEDEEALRRTSRRILERMGYRVVVAADGQAGLEEFRARAEEISVVLSDQDMPEMTGSELLRKLQESGSSVPFVLTTGRTARDLTGEHELPERVEVLSKPWSVEELTRAIRAALDRGRI